MVDFDSPLDQEFLDESYQAQREAWGDDLTRPIQFDIGRLNADGSVSTVVTSGEFGRIWVRQPGEDTGDAVQAINTILQPHEISFNRPVMVKQQRGEFIIVARAPESANYDAQLPVGPQRPTNREQYNLAMIRPSQPNSSFYASYIGAIFQLNSVAYRITDSDSSDFSGTVPGSNAISIKVEIDPTTATWHETTGGAFTGGIIDAFKDGDLDTARTEGRFLIGWIRLYDGQTAIELEDILLAEHMLDLIDDHGELVNRDDGDQHANYVYLTPAASTRNTILPTANNAIVPLRVKKFAGAGGTESLIEFYDENDAITSIIKSTGNIDARNITLDYTRTPNSVDPIISSTYTWNPVSSPGGGSHVIDDRFIDYATGNSSAGVLIGHQTGLDVTGNGVINLRVYQAYLGNDGAGTIPKAALYYGFAPWNDGGGAITDLHGIFLEDINVGVNNYSIRLNAGNAFFNDGGDADSDFRWSSDTEPNMLFGDAGTEQVFIGGTTNGMKIDKGGNTYWIGNGGLIGGHMCIPGVDIIVGITDNNPTEVFDDDTTSLGDGWSAGELNGVTFPTGGDEHYLQITKPGIYRINWDMSFNMAAPGANIQVHGGVMINGTATRNNGEAHRTIANNSDTGLFGGVARIACPNGTEQISLWVLNADNNNNVTVVHGNVDIELIGGT